jgi:hypothetical protein
MEADMTGEIHLSLCLVADNPVETLCQSHQQLHIDFGFTAILKYD